MKKNLAFLLAVALTMCLVACSFMNTTSDAIKEKKEQLEEKRYAVILKTHSSPFWKTMQQAIDDYAKENNLLVDFYSANSEMDDEGQLAIVRQCIKSGDYLGIAIAPVNGITLVPAIKEANDEGITIVNIDEQLNPDEMELLGATCSGFVASDNVSIGYMGAEYLCSLLKSNSSVAVIEGIAGNISSEERAEGAKNAFEEMGMQVIADKACDWNTEVAYDTAKEWISKYPNLKAIYCCNDEMAAGVRRAVAEVKADILVCGTDGDEDALDAVAKSSKNGTGMVATVAQEAGNIGVTALRMLVSAVEDPEKYPASAEPIKTPVDAVLVTEENVDSYLEE